MFSGEIEVMEVMAIRWGLKEAQIRHFDNLEVQLDCSNVMKGPSWIIMLEYCISQFSFTGFGISYQ